MNPVQVDTAISKASRLMNEGYMGLLDNIAAQNSGKPGKRGVNDLAYLEQQAFGYGAKPSTSSYTPPVQQSMPQQYPIHKLPQACFLHFQQRMLL